MTRRATAAGALAGLVLAVLAVLAGCAAPAPSDVASDGSGHDDADVAFATAMVPHHMQAVAMAHLATDRAQSTDVKALARQIDAEQLPEVVQLQGLLTSWGRPAAPTAPMPAMAGMTGMAGMSGPGMMTDEDMRELGAASGPAFDHLFLKLMIKHHGAGVAMANTELSDGENADAQQLAENISDSQQAQTTWMMRMLSGSSGS